jgi:hypothetical protein
MKRARSIRAIWFLPGISQIVILLKSASIRAARLGHATQNGRAEKSFIEILSSFEKRADHFSFLVHAVRGLCILKPPAAFQAACSILP